MASPASAPTTQNPVGNEQSDGAAVTTNGDSHGHDEDMEDEEDDEEDDEDDDDDEDEEDEEEEEEDDGAVPANESDEEKQLRVVSAALAKVLPPGGFFVCGERAVFPHPGIVVKDFGDVGLPLAGDAAKALISKCHLAPYGLGEQTLVDTQVRDTWEVSADQLEIQNPAWDTMVQSDILAACRIPLGIAEETQVQAKLYKMLLYEAGGKFEKHQDSEKEDGMFGTLVIVLPGRFEGGELVVHDPSAASSVNGAPVDGSGKTNVWDPATADPFAIKYAAFYGDCPHEVKPVTKGYRLCLTYNLVNVDSQATLPHFGGNHVLYESLKQALYQYFWDEQTTSQKRQRLDEDGASQPVASSVFDVETQHTALLASVLTHKYTKVGLSFKYLKNKDLLVAQCLARFCEETGGAFALYLSKLRYRFRWHGSEEGSSYSRKTEKGVTRTLTLLYPWVKYGAPNDSELANDDDDVASRMPDRRRDDGLEVDPAIEVAPRGMFSRTGFRFDGTNEQLYTGNDGANIDKWYSSAALVVVSLKQDAKFDFQVAPRVALKLFEQAVETNALANARAMAAVFGEIPQKWSLLSEEGVAVIKALGKLGSLDAYKNILASCLQVEFQPMLHCVLEQFDTSAVFEMLKALDKSWANKIFDKYVHRNRVNVGASILDGVTDPTVISSVLDAVVIAPHAVEPSDFEDLEPSGEDTLPDAYTLVLRLALAVSVERVKALLHAKPVRALVMVTVPAALAMVKELSESTDPTATQAIINHLRTLLEAALPELRNLAFEVEVPSWLYSGDSYKKLAAFGESDDLSMELDRTEFESTIQDILERENMVSRVTIEPLESTVRVTKSYECKALLKAKEQLATLDELANRAGK